MTANEFPRCHWMSGDTHSQCILAEGHESGHMWQDWYLERQKDDRHLRLDEIFGSIEIK